MDFVTVLLDFFFFSITKC